jgi:hypothetical protein
MRTLSKARIIEWGYLLSILLLASLWAVGLYVLLHTPGKTGWERLGLGWWGLLLYGPLCASGCLVMMGMSHFGSGAGRFRLGVAGLVVLVLWVGLFLLWTGRIEYYLR